MQTKHWSRRPAGRNLVRARRTDPGAPKTARTWRALVVLMSVVTCLGAAALPANAAVPGNDDFNSPTTISALPFNIESDTSEATRANDDPNDCVGTNTVWFSYTPANDTRVELDTTGSDYYTYVAIWTGQRGSLQQVACASGMGAMRFSATAGQTYHIVVSGSWEGGILSLAAALAPPPPHNDERTTAKGIGPLPFKHEIDTSEATFAAGDPRCGGRRASVWYSITRDKARRLQFDTLKSDYDTSLSVYTRSHGTLTRVACSNDAAQSRQSRARVALKARKRYLIMVTAGRSGGNLILRVKDAPPPFHVQLHIARLGRVSRVTGEAVVKGTVRCNRSSKVYLSTTIKQVVGQHVISSSFSRSFQCKGLMRWRAKLGSNRALRSGAAKVSARVISSKFDKHDLASKIVRLRT
jgi:hypothetical protein